MIDSTVHHGDCLEVLRTLADCSVDAVVTDPPYGLSFMGRKWDYDVPSVDVWAECLRVLKPGGHLLAFAGTRTQHRMAVRIEDAGFEIRDMIAWVYSTGFPKSLDVSKAIDKNNGETGRLHRFTEWMRTTGLSASQINDATGTCMGSHYLTDKSQPAIPTSELWARLRPLCGDIPGWVDELVERIEAEREVVGRKTGLDGSGFGNVGHGLSSTIIDITAPATDAARQWSGWGTALKPALEPITVARKPLIGTVAANVLEWGTGAMNIDGARVPTDPSIDDPRLGGAGTWGTTKMAKNVYEGGYAGEVVGSSPLGRWPANLIHDGSEEAISGMGECSRYFYCPKASKADRDEGCGDLEMKRTAKPGGADNDRESLDPVSERFRTQPSRNNHPTVKPTALMRYLCRLVTPPGGVVLDPFTGSGSTGKAAALEGFRFIGIEREAEYVEIAKARINASSESLLCGSGT